MRKVILYIAASLDGYIARPDGDVAWLESFPNPEQTDHGYADLMEEIDTTLMGNETYKAILGFGIPFPYSDKTNYVFTRNTSPQNGEFVRFVSGDMAAFVREIKAQSGKSIWLIGGGQVIRLLMDAGLVDEYRVAIMPIVLGEGIPLFPKPITETRLRLVSAKAYGTGAVMLTYRPESDQAS